MTTEQQTATKPESELQSIPPNKTDELSDKESKSQMEKQTGNKSLAEPLSERIERSLLILVLAVAIFLLFSVPIPVF